MRRQKDKGREVTRFWSLILGDSAFPFSTMDGAKILHLWFSKALIRFFSRIPTLGSFLRPAEAILHQCDHVFPLFTSSRFGSTSHTCFSIFSTGTLFHSVLRLPSQLPKCMCRPRWQENYRALPRNHGTGVDKLTGKVYAPQWAFSVPPINLPPPCWPSNNLNHLLDKCAKPDSNILQRIQN